MAYAFYVVVKLIAYIGWCWVGVRLWRPGRATVWSAFSFGILRLAIGVMFGVIIFFAVPTSPENLLWKYVAIYAPVRLVEWSILAFVITRSSDRGPAFNWILWCLGGIVVSFVADFASPEGVAGHFCVGRCLC